MESVQPQYVHHFEKHPLVKSSPFGKLHGLEAACIQHPIVEIPHLCQGMLSIWPSIFRFFPGILSFRKCPDQGILADKRLKEARD